MAEPLDFAKRLRVHAATGLPVRIGLSPAEARSLAAQLEEVETRLGAIEEVRTDINGRIEAARAHERRAMELLARARRKLTSAAVLLAVAFATALAPWALAAWEVWR